MKFRVTMKDPDTLYDAANDALDEQGAPEGVNDNEWERLKEGRSQDYMDIAHTWFQYGEYLTVEIDTEAKTCTVIPVGG